MCFLYTVPKPFSQTKPPTTFCRFPKDTHRGSRGRTAPFLCPSPCLPNPACDLHRCTPAPYTWLWMGLSRDGHSAHLIWSSQHPYPTGRHEYVKHHLTRGGLQWYKGKILYSLLSIFIFTSTTRCLARS